MADQISIQDLIFGAINNDSLSELRKLFGKSDKAGQNEYLRNRNELGETPLAVAIKLKRYEIIYWLVNVLRDCVINKLCSLLCLPTLCQIRINQISVMEMMDYLLDPWPMEQRRNSDEPIWLEFLYFSIRISSFTQVEMVFAIELIGCAFIFHQSGNRSNQIGEPYLSDHGLRYWGNAIRRRNSYSGKPAITKIPYELTNIANKAFGGNTEWQGMEELKQFEREAVSESDSGLPVWRIENTEWYFQLRVQALLVTQRIVCQVNPGRDARPYYFHLIHLTHLGLDCKSKRNNFNQAINIGFLILEQSKGLNPTTSSCSPKCINIFLETFDLLSKCFKKVKERGATISATDILMAITYCPAIASLLLVSSIKERDHNFHKVNLFVYDFVLLLSNMQLSQLEKKELEENLSDYVRHSVHQGSCLLLHIVVKKFIWFHGTVSQDVIQLLFRAGVDPNATDKKGKTPLHILAERLNRTRLSSFDGDQFPTQTFSNLFQRLVNAGGHLDQATPDGKTVLSILNEKRSERSHFRFDPYLISLANVVLPLSCYCATTIRRNRIPYDSHIPRRLRSFVSRHSALKR